MNRLFQLNDKQVRLIYTTTKLPSQLSKSINNTILKRYAGGGGRPGGKPTFNWKERKQLGLDNINKKPFKLNPQMGLWDDIKDHFDESKGDKMIDITDLENFEEDPEDLKRLEDKGYVGENNTRKQINIKKLFGSSKAKSVGPVSNLGGSHFTGYKETKRVFPRQPKNRFPSPFTRIESRLYKQSAASASAADSK